VTAQPASPADPLPLGLHQCAAGLVARVVEQGVTLTVGGAETLLAQRHDTAATQLGSTEHSARPYLDQAALDALAERLVATSATEEPSGDLLALPRSARIPALGCGVPG
jgi:hypothetical protein